MSLEYTLPIFMVVEKGPGTFGPGGPIVCAVQMITIMQPLVFDPPVSHNPSKFIMPGRGQGQISANRPATRAAGESHDPAGDRQRTASES